MKNFFDVEKTEKQQIYETAYMTEWHRHLDYPQVTYYDQLHLTPTKRYERTRIGVNPVSFDKAYPTLTGVWREAKEKGVFLQDGFVSGDI